MLRDIKETAHLRSTLTNERVATDDSGQALPRRPQLHAYRCFLPDLAGFTSLRRVGPGPQRPPAVILAHRTGLWEGFNPAVADCGCRAPLAPHLVRPLSHSRFRRPLCQFVRQCRRAILSQRNQPCPYPDPLHSRSHPSFPLPPVIPPQAGIQAPVLRGAFAGKAATISDPHLRGDKLRGFGAWCGAITFQDAITLNNAAHGKQVSVVGQRPRC